MACVFKCFKDTKLKIPSKTILPSTLEVYFAENSW